MTRADQPPASGTVKQSGPWIPSVTVGVRKWLITNPDREGGDVKSNGQIDFFTASQPGEEVLHFSSKFQKPGTLN